MCTSHTINTDTLHSSQPLHSFLKKTLKQAYSCSGRSVHVHDAAYVGTHGVDGSMWAETSGVNPQVGGALLDYIPNDVDLDLRKESREISRLDFFFK